MFDYQPGRSGEYVRAFLKGWKGHMVVDDYAGYKALFGLGITEVGCMAYARRRFFELHASNQSSVAAEALRRIAELYEIEGRGRKLDAEQRQQLRAQETSLKRWPALSRYALSGNLPIDNNPVETVIRPIVVGMKNWLFTGSERASRRAAAIQSLLKRRALKGRPIIGLPKHNRPPCNIPLDAHQPTQGVGGDGDVVDEQVISGCNDLLIRRKVWPRV